MAQHTLGVVAGDVAIGLWAGCLVCDRDHRDGPNSIDTVLTIQNGLAAKVEKASRKLRKERKNRGKKVSHQYNLSAWQ
jgi:hypothetical protein